MGCGCTETPCVPISGTSCYGFTASADDLNGTNFTTPANPTQAYQGILLTPFNVTPIFNSPGNWSWWLANLQTLSNKTSTPSASFTTTPTILLSLTVPITGNYIANWAGIVKDTNGGLYNFSLGILKNGSLLDITAGTLNTGLGVANLYYPLAGQLAKVALTAGDVITLVGDRSNDGIGAITAVFEQGVLTLQQVNP